jgi:hypothetical protein
MFTFTGLSLQIAGAYALRVVEGAGDQIVASRSSH